MSDAEKPWYSELYGKGISPASVGRYRQVLQQEEINFIQREGAGIFRIFGYWKKEEGRKKEEKGKCMSIYSNPYKNLTAFRCGGTEAIGNG